ncbi:hypothetical protein [Mycolicibacterium bacteremicum]|nr:hypothetical protein [Mycolicibacterium bacteremicum]
MTDICIGDDFTHHDSPAGRVQHSLHGNIDETSTTREFSTAVGF